MTVDVRLTRPLYDQVMNDLLRPHPFAAERVGFLFCKLAITENDALVLLSGYESLHDERYIDDPSAGARIDTVAIRGAMQRVINRREGVFHVHLHKCPGIPRFSEMDREELPRVVAGFHNAGPEYAHGIILLSNDAGVARVWLPANTTPKWAGRITVVGFPMVTFNGGTR